MKDMTREKFLQLMTRIEELEEIIDDLEKKEKEGENSQDDPGRKRILDDLKSLRDELSEKRRELARISDGCGKPHTA